VGRHTHAVVHCCCLAASGSAGSEQHITVAAVGQCNAVREATVQKQWQDRAQTVTGRMCVCVCGGGGG
jgi:hypothetical protein